jgi:glutathione S-transferase
VAITAGQATHGKVPLLPQPLSIIKPLTPPAARIILNYKQIPYRTIWLSHPEIEATFKDRIPPNNDRSLGSPYTVPVIQLPSGELLMESTAIAYKLEELYPQPSLQLESGMHEKAQQAGMKLGGPLLPLFMPIAGRDMIRADSQPWFYEAREKMFGMPLDEYERLNKNEGMWEKAKPGMAAMRDLCTDNKVDDGPFILGSKPSYGDMRAVALLEGFRRMQQAMFDRIVDFDEKGNVRRMWEACQGWMERDDH